AAVTPSQVVAALTAPPHDPGEHALQPVDLGAKPLRIYLQLVCVLDEIGDGRLELIEFGEHARIISNISSLSSEINRQFYSTPPNTGPPSAPKTPSSQPVQPAQPCHRTNLRPPTQPIAPRADPSARPTTHAGAATARPAPRA